MDTKSLKDGAEAVAAMVPGEEARKALGDTPDTVLYLSGASGTGKSSLVAAGLTPALTAKGWTVLPCGGWARRWRASRTRCTGLTTLRR